MAEDPVQAEVLQHGNGSRLALVGSADEERRAEERASQERRIEDLVGELLGLLGEDPRRPGLVKTPARVRKALGHLTAGYRMRPEDVVGDALFAEETTGEVIVRGIEFYSHCEHHMLPFHGRVHIGYLPDQHVVGLSKLPRLVDIYARRLQVQERLTEQIADAIDGVLGPRGVAVAVEAVHMCMTMRGVEKQHSSTMTSAFRGEYAEEAALRSEFLRRANP